MKILQRGKSIPLFSLFLLIYLCSSQVVVNQFSDRDPKNIQPSKQQPRENNQLKKQIVGDLGRVIIVSISIVIVVLQVFSFVHHRHLQNVVNFALFKSSNTVSQSKFNELVEKQIPVGSKQSQKEVRRDGDEPKAEEIHNNQSPKRRRKRKTDKLNSINNTNQQVTSNIQKQDEDQSHRQ